jgi:hypothetical protein
VPSNFPSMKPIPVTECTIPRQELMRNEVRTGAPPHLCIGEHLEVVPSQHNLLEAPLIGDSGRGQQRPHHSSSYTAQEGQAAGE